MPTFTAGVLGVNFDDLDLTGLAQAQLVGATSNGFSVGLDSETLQIGGSGLVYGLDGLPASGVITDILAIDRGITIFTATGLSVDAGALHSLIVAGDSDGAKAAIFAGDDSMIGSNAGDLLRGYGGDDSIIGGSADDLLNGGDGNNSINGGAGDDVIVATSGSNYLRGGDGDDHIIGGSGFDDINGNKGADTIDGGSGGNDWLVGGQGDDFIFATHGHNLIYGNLGDDTLNAGDEGDTLRGGQGDDVIVGGAGNDYISGDRGNDTETGGPGADIFHSFSGAGKDVVTDFNQAEGDRVLLDPGTSFSVSQVGADTVVDMGNGDQLILKNVQLSSLHDGWISVGLT